MKSLNYFHNFENLTQIISIFIVSLTMLNDGFLLCWSSYATVVLTNPNHPLKITIDEASYFTILPCIGTILSSLPAGFLGSKIGRKKTLLLCTISYFVSGLLLGVGNSLWTFYIGRFIHGFGTAGCYSAGPIYSSETSLPIVRGKWGNLLVINFNAGVLICYIISSYLSLLEVSYVCMGIPVIAFFLLLWVPESPYYLIKIQDFQQAKKSLQWLRQHEDVNEELSSIQRVVERQMASPSTYKDIFLTICNRKALIAVLAARFAQLFSGAIALQVYVHTIFTMAGSDISVSTSTIICGSVQYTFAIIGSMMNYKFGRRPAIFLSSSIYITFLTLMTIYFYLDSLHSMDFTNWTWIPIVGLVGSLGAYTLGLGLIPTVLSGELFSSGVKENAICITNIWYTALIASSSKIFQELVKYGLQTPFLFFAISSAISLVVCYFVIPETKGKTLDEIQLDFLGKKIPVEDPKRTED